MSGGGGALIAMKPPLVTLPHHSTFAHRAIARHRCSRPTSHVPPVILTRLGCEQPRWWCRTRQSLLSLAPRFVPGPAAGEGCLWFAL